MNVLKRLLNENFDRWDRLVQEYEQVNLTLKVPEVDKTSLYCFNVKVEEQYTKALYDFARAKRNKDAIQRLIKNTLDDYYKGSNEQARKAAGIQFAKNYPAPDNYPFETVNLFDLEDRFLGYYYALEATVKSLQAKAEAKITNNSLLNIENEVVSY